MLLTVTFLDTNSYNLRLEFIQFCPTRCPTSFQSIVLIFLPYSCSPKFQFCIQSLTPNHSNLPKYPFDIWSSPNICAQRHSQLHTLPLKYDFTLMPLIKQYAEIKETISHFVQKHANIHCT